MATKMNAFFNDIVGIVRTPGVTLGKSMSEKKWVPMLLFLAIAVGIFAYISYPVHMKMLSENAELSGYMSEADLAQYYQPSTFSRLMYCFFFQLQMVLSLIFGAFFVYLFYGIGGSEGLFVNYFSLVAGASLIDIFFPGVLQTLSMLTGIKLGVISNPLLLVLSPESKSLMFLIIARLDIFTIWYMVIIALGMAVYSKMDIKKSFTISILYFLFKSAIGIAFGYIVIQLMGQ
jgi:hypothetical protein